MKRLSMPAVALGVFFLSVPLVRAQEWERLFDGASFSGWKTTGDKEIGAGWEIKEGALHLHGKGGDIFTEREFFDFELEFEWKIASGVNSGLKYRVADYRPAGGNIGLEYQLLDDARHADGRSRLTATASIYALVPSATPKKLETPGAWNRARIVAAGPQIEHWLNGEKVASVTIGTPAWTEALANSKFRAAPDFGTRRGRILLQDHGGEVWFRNLRIRALTQRRS